MMGGPALPGDQTPGCLVFCGQNLSESWPTTWQSIQKMLGKEPKPKLIVVDPRRTRLAERADMWLQIRPGTDAALLAGMDERYY